jgi:hypothetical protein
MGCRRGACYSAGRLPPEVGLRRRAIGERPSCVPLAKTGEQAPEGAPFDDG